MYVGQNANRTDILLLIGAIYYQLGNYKQCIAFNDRCIMLDPHMAEAHANLANALQQLSNFDMAMIYYQVRQSSCARDPSAARQAIARRCPCVQLAMAQKMGTQVCSLCFVLVVTSARLHKLLFFTNCWCKSDCWLGK